MGTKKSTGIGANVSVPPSKMTSTVRDVCTSRLSAYVRGFFAVGHLAVGQFAVKKMLVSVGLG